MVVDAFKGTGQAPEVTEQVDLGARPGIAVVASAAMLHHWTLREAGPSCGLPAYICEYQLLSTGQSLPAWPLPHLQYNAASATAGTSHLLTLHTRIQPDAILVECRGRLVREATDQFRQTVKPLLTQTKCVVLDLTGLVHMDSSGLGALVGLYVSAKTAGCQLQLINLSQRIRQLLGITHLLSAFEACGKYGIKM